MLISVIIPVYNVEKYLKNCIDSVLAQNFKDYEIILVDDGSPDNSGDICDEYAANYDFITVIHQKNKGQGGARNTAIDIAKGEYLLFLDSDDSILPNAFEYFHEQLCKFSFDIICFGMKNIDESGETVLTYRPIDNGQKILNTKDYLIHYIGNSFCANKLYKATLFKNNNIRFPEKRWYEDFEAISKLVLHTNKVLITDKIFYSYLLRSNSTMHIKNADRNIDMVTVVKEILNYYKSQNKFDEYYDILEYLTILHVLVLATVRVASLDPKHKLLAQFYDFVKSNFPNFRKNCYLKENLPRRRKLIYILSLNKMYKALFLLNKLNNLR